MHKVNSKGKQVQSGVRNIHLTEEGKLSGEIHPNVVSSGEPYSTGEGHDFVNMCKNVSLKFNNENYFQTINKGLFIF